MNRGSRYDHVRWISFKTKSESATTPRFFCHFVTSSSKVARYLKGGRRKEEGGSRKEEGERRKEKGERRKEEGGRRKEEGGGIMEVSTVCQYRCSPIYLYSLVRYYKLVF
jgi:hypothetical protein